MLQIFRLRVVFIFILIALGFVCLMLGFKFMVVLSCWALAILLSLGYIFFGTVNGAMFALNSGKAEQAEQLLSQTINPKLLLNSHKAYYFFTKGLIQLYKVNQTQNEDLIRSLLNEAETDLNQSLSYGLKRKSERAMAYLNLSHIAFRKKDKPNLFLYLEKTRDNQTEDIRLEQSIQELEQAILKVYGSQES